MNIWPFEGSDWDLTQLSSKARVTSIKSFLFQSVCNFFPTKLKKSICFQLFSTNVGKVMSIKCLKGLSCHFVVPLVPGGYLRFLAVICRFSNSQKVYLLYVSLSLSLSLSFCRSGHVSSSLWSDVREVWSQLDCFCMTISKVLSQWVSESVSDKVTYWAVVDS